MADMERYAHSEGEKLGGGGGAININTGLNIVLEFTLEGRIADVDTARFGHNPLPPPTHKFLE